LLASLRNENLLVAATGGEEMGLAVLGLNVVFSLGVGPGGTGESGPADALGVAEVVGLGALGLFLESSFA
jgi:hypothetical protein